MAHKEAVEKEGKPLHDEDIQLAIRQRESLLELRAQEEILQRLRLRLADERINQAIEQSKAK